MAWTIRFKKEPLFYTMPIYHPNLNMFSIKFSLIITSVKCVFHGPIQKIMANKRFYMCKEGDLGLIHTGLENRSVATEQPLVSRKKFVFSNQLLVGGEAVGCRWVKLVTKTYTDG